MVMGLPLYQELFLITIVLSFIMSVMSRLLTDQNKIRKIKEDMKFYREKAGKAQKSGDLKKANEYTSQMMKASQGQFKENMKPMLLSFVIFIAALGWFRVEYASLEVLSPISIPFIGASLNWFWWYLIIILPSSMIFRKVLDVQ